MFGPRASGVTYSSDFKLLMRFIDTTRINFGRKLQRKGQPTRFRRRDKNIKNGR